MNDTPETDACIAATRGGSLVVLCKKLERERDKLKVAIREIASMDTSENSSPQQCGAVLIAMNTLEKLK